MTDTYNDTTGSRKKFLIPLVVLLLCAVSLTGAGYAYNTSVSNTGTIDDGSDVLIMTTDKTGETEKTTALGDAAGKMYVTTATVIAPTAGVTATVQGTATVTVFFKLVSTGGQLGTYSLTTATCTLANAGLVTVASADAENQTFALVASGATVVKAADDSVVDIAELTAGTTYKATFTITVGADDNVHFGNATAVDDAAAVITALEAVVYTVTLNAEPTA